MTLSVLIPWRSDDLYRNVVWDHLRALWRQRDVELCCTDDGLTGRFSYAAGANRCRQLATGDMLLCYGADQYPPDEAQLRRIRRRLERLPWIGVYAHTRVYAQWATRLILAGEPRERFADMSMMAPVAVGIVAMRADVWDDVGGMDERFRGWGAEDVAFRIALQALYPDGDGTGEGISETLYHEAQPWDDLTANNNRLCAEYQAAAAEGRMREYLKERQ